MRFMFQLLTMFAITLGAFQAQAAPPYAMNKLLYKTVTITSGQTVSAAVDIGGYALVGYTLPATMTGTALSFQVSTSLGGTYVGYYDDTGALVTKTIAGGRYYAMLATTVHGFQYLKLVSGTAEGADRVITLHLKAI